MKTDNENKIVTIDGAGKILGRLASNIAMILMGKNKSSFERNKYSGSSVVVTNSSKIKISSKKLDSMYHTRYSGRPGGLRITSGTETLEKKGMKELLYLSIYKMLPKNKLRKQMLKNLKIEN